MYQCIKCQHSEVCKYKEEYKAIVETYSTDELPKYIDIEFKCRKFKEDKPTYIPYIPDDNDDIYPYEITFTHNSDDYNLTIEDLKKEIRRNPIVPNKK